MKKKKAAFLDVKLSADLVEKLYREVLSGLGEQGVVPEIESPDVDSEPFVLNRAVEKNLPAPSHRLKEAKSAIKNLLLNDLEKALSELRTLLDPNSLSFDSVVLLTGKFYRISSAYHSGQIDFQTAELEFTKIGSAVMYMVNKLEEDELVAPSE